MSRPVWLTAPSRGYQFVFQTIWTIVGISLHDSPAAWSDKSRSAWVRLAGCVYAWRWVPFPHPPPGLPRFPDLKDLLQVGGGRGCRFDKTTADTWRDLRIWLRSLGDCYQWRQTFRLWTWSRVGLKVKQSSTGSVANVVITVKHNAHT